MSKLQIIIGSTREGHAAEAVQKWVANRAEARGSFDVEVVDLRDWPLPFFAETVHTIGDFADPTFSAPIVKAWNTKIAEGDAFIFITPEYNHSFPAVLKNALDSVFITMALRNKPGAMVGYSGGPIGGSRAVEHLAHVLIEQEMVPLRDTVLVGNVEAAFGDDGEPTAPATDIALEILFEDLEWWTPVLNAARATGELPAGKFRFMGKLAALTPA